MTDDIQKETERIHQGIVESLSFSEALAKRDAEIERLRESVKFLNSFRPDAELAKRDAEIERLREELSHCLHLDNHNAIVANLNNQIEHMSVAIENSGSMAFAYKQEQEIERLRELLREALLGPSQFPDWFIRRVREALGER